MLLRAWRWLINCHVSSQHPCYSKLARRPAWPGPNRSSTMAHFRPTSKPTCMLLCPSAYMYVRINAQPLAANQARRSPWPALLVRPRHRLEPNSPPSPTGAQLGSLSLASRAQRVQVEAAPLCVAETQVPSAGPRSQPQSWPSPFPSRRYSIESASSSSPYASHALFFRRTAPSAVTRARDPAEP
jgi:hypothetical protein